MKKIIKSRLFYFILGAIIFSGISTAFAYSFFAEDVGFAPKDTNWEVNDVQEALDDLREKLTDVEFIDLTTKTTSSNQCYNLDSILGIIDRKNNEMYLRVKATKKIEDCNTSYTTDISKLNFSSVTYKKNLDFGNSSNYRFTSNSASPSTLVYYVDTNYGYGTKQNYNYWIYYSFTK